MQSFTVHLDTQSPDTQSLGPHNRRPTLASAEKAIFVADGFCFPAFVFGGFWLAYKRLWLALCVFLIVLAVLTGLGAWFALNPLAVSALSMLLNLFLGIEGYDIQRRTLERNGLAAVAIITARKLEDAEAKFFGALEPRLSPLPGPGLEPTAKAAILPILPPTHEVIGMFPLPGGRS